MSKSNRYAPCPRPTPGPGYPLVGGPVVTVAPGRHRRPAPELQQRRRRDAVQLSRIPPVTLRYCRPAGRRHVGYGRRRGAWRSAQRHRPAPAWASVRTGRLTGAEPPRGRRSGTLPRLSCIPTIRRRPCRGCGCQGRRRDGPIPETSYPQIMRRSITLAGRPIRRTGTTALATATATPRRVTTASAVPISRYRRATQVRVTRPPRAMTAAKTTGPPRASSPILAILQPAATVRARAIRRLPDRRAAQAAALRCPRLPRRGHDRHQPGGRADGAVRRPSGRAGRPCLASRSAGQRLARARRADAEQRRQPGGHDHPGRMEPGHRDP